jgi:hypothetical protein
LPLRNRKKVPKTILKSHDLLADTVATPGGLEEIAQSSAGGLVATRIRYGILARVRPAQGEGEKGWRAVNFDQAGYAAPFFFSDSEARSGGLVSIDASRALVSELKTK